MSALYSRLVAVIALASAALAGCSVSTEPDDTLVIRGAGRLPTSPAAKSPQGITSQLDPASLQVGLYAIALSTQADCSDPIIIQDHGDTPVVVDLLSDPVIFSGSPPDGAYPCVIFKMSDVLHFSTATSQDGCAAGVDYVSDVYRVRETDWLDMNGAAVIGHGSDDAPVDDGVTLLLTTDPAAVQARGYSPHQIIALTSDLVVPGQSTFYWNGAGSVVSEGGGCYINPGVPSFE
jgi:hypothetical protein